MQKSIFFIIVALAFSELTAQKPIGVRVAVPDNLADGCVLVASLLIVGFNDPIADPVAEITELGRGGVVEPVGEVGLVHVGRELGLDLGFMAGSRRPKGSVSDIA